MEIFMLVGYSMSVTSILILFAGWILNIRTVLRKLPWSIVYLGLMLAMECTSVIFMVLDYKNYSFFAFAYYIHFAFLLQLFLRRIFAKGTRFLPLILAITAIPILLHVFFQLEGTPQQSYQRAIYSFGCALLSLFGILALVQNKLQSSRAHLWLLLGVLLFFFMDTIWALGFLALLNVGIWVKFSFWLFRGLCLQNFYLAIIYYTWKTGKTL